MAANKDTLYIDIDDEITSLIDKVRASNGKIVALVLPKRATVLQSIVNMKLLKRAADTSKKNIVLVTTEASLMPLAGAVGLHVAKTPQSKPEIPAAPQTDFDGEETINEEEPIDLSEEAAAPATAVSAAAAAAVATRAPGPDDVETLEIDNDATSKPVIAAPAAAMAAKKLKKNKKLAVPNFERFRLLLIAGVVGLLLLIGGAVYALTVLPKAVIAIQTDASNLNVSSDMTLNTQARSVDVDEGEVPAKLVQQQKTLNQQAAASGQRNNGEKAQGEVAFRTDDCSGNLPEDIPAFTGISTGGKTYITQESAEFDARVVNRRIVCETDAVKVIAQTGGAAYNVAENTTFSVANRSGVTGSATDQFSGGTDNIVKIVTQSDIDAARQKLAAQDGTVRQELRRQLEDTGYYAIADTYSTGTPSVTTSVAAGTVADTVTVTQITNFTMLGAREKDLNAVIDDNARSQIDTSRQTILSRGLDDATFAVGENSAVTAQVTVQTVVTAGPDLDIEEIKKQIAGKKAGEVRAQLQSNPGVNNVEVKLSPFYVTSVPKKSSKVTITIADPTPAKNSDDNSN